MDKNSKSKKLKAGGYSVLATCLLLAVLIVLNAVVAALPTTFTQFDMTDSEMYTLSDTTKDLIRQVDQPVMIYHIVRAGREDERIVRLLDRYKALNRNISLESVDPDVYPNFTAQYTDERLNENSLIIVSGENSTYVDYYQIYEYDYSTYSQTGDLQLSFAGEGAITAGIDYVVNGDFPKIYALSGHGESPVSDSYRIHVRRQNIDLVQELSILTNDVPEDAEAIAIVAPQSDINEQEKEKLLAYLKKGGNLFVILEAAQDGPLVNLNAVLSEYGIDVVYGIVVESDSSYYMNQTPHNLLPDIKNHSITYTLQSNKYFVQLPMSEGLTSPASVRGSLKVSPLLGTSGTSYAKVHPFTATTYEKEEGDVDGPFAVAAVATENDTNVIVIGSKYIMDATANSQVAGGNEEFFLSCVNYLVDNEVNITIGSKLLDYSTLTLTDTQSNALTVLFCVLLPAVFLVTGFCIWFFRRKR